MLIKKSKTWSIFNYLKFLFYPFLCFVLLESSGSYAETPNAFIFSLNNFERLAPFVSKVKTKGRAIDRHLTYGPKFGDDLVIYLDAQYIIYSKAHLGAYYSVPASVTDKFKILAGLGNQQRFSLDEVEVFYLHPSR